MSDFKEFTNEYLQKLSSCFTIDQVSQMEVLSESLENVWENNNTVFLCGNGGSGANALHIANDLHFGLGDMLINKKNGLKADALTSNTAVLSCLANDLGYESIFSNQIDVKASKGDILIALSGSGNSPNIIKAINLAKDKGIKTFSILGFDGGICKNISDFPIHFHIGDMQIAEDTQVIVLNICIKWIINRKNEKYLKSKD